LVIHHFCFEHASIRIWDRFLVRQFPEKKAREMEFSEGWNF
jgi:hypothetical protein